MFAAGALPCTQLGELAALPRHLSWFSEGRFASGEGVRKGEGGRREREGDGRGGERSPTSFFYNLTTDYYYYYYYYILLLLPTCLAVTSAS